MVQCQDCFSQCRAIARALLLAAESPGSVAKGRYGSPDGIALMTRPHRRLLPALITAMHICLVPPL